MNSNEFNKRIDHLTEKGWELVDEGRQLSRHYSFEDFNQAFELMSRVAKKAEQLDHHPDWWNSYNELGIHLTTYSAGQLTEKDLDLAEYTETQAWEV